MANSNITFHPLTGFDLVKADEIQKGTFAAANNQAAAANVTGLDLAANDEATVTIHASLDATADDSLKYTLDIYSTGTDFVLVQTQTGPNALNINFSITTLGQIQYTSDTYAGFVTLDLAWKYIK